MPHGPSKKLLGKALMLNHSLPLQCGTGYYISLRRTCCILTIPHQVKTSVTLTSSSKPRRHCHLTLCKFFVLTQLENFFPRREFWKVSLCQTIVYIFVVSL